MKKVGQFLIALVVMITIAYLEPVFFPEDLPEKEASITENMPKRKKAVKVSFKETPATSYAALIGKTEKDLRQVSGKPAETFPTALGMKWLLYEEDGQVLFVAGIKEGKVTNLFQVSNSAALFKEETAFLVGMSLNRAARLGHINSFYQMKLGEMRYTFELSERDMRIRPLVAFDNQSVAQLYVDEENKTVIGIRYMDQTSLAELSPYEFTEGEAINVTIDENVNWDEIGKKSSLLYHKLYQQLVSNAHKKPLEITSEKTNQGQRALKTLLMNPEDVIVARRKLQEWQFHLENPSYQSAFRLSGSDFADFWQEVFQRDGEVPKFGLILAPSLDIPWVLMATYDRISNSDLNSAEDVLKMSYNRDLMMIWSAEKKTEQTSSSKEESSGSQKEEQTTTTTKTKDGP